MLAWGNMAAVVSEVIFMTSTVSKWNKRWEHSSYKGAICLLLSIDITSASDITSTTSVRSKFAVLSLATQATSRWLSTHSRAREKAGALNLESLSCNRRYSPRSLSLGHWTLEARGEAIDLDFIRNMTVTANVPLESLQPFCLSKALETPPLPRDCSSGEFLRFTSRFRAKWAVYFKESDTNRRIRKQHSWNLLLRSSTSCLAG